MVKDSKAPKLSTNKPFTIACAIIAGLLGVLTFQIQRSIAPAPLPKPELSEGQRGELGIDKNINEKNIDAYLNRPDSVYYDMRMLDDPATYENIGGDSQLSGFVRGFSVIPYPYLATVKGLPEAVGQGYSGPTLFTITDDNKYRANYEESEKILNDLFPKDKYIFLMCGGGGYAGMTKNLLINQGWDQDKIYVVGGFWYYEGENIINVKETTPDGQTTYAFWKVPYHQITFSELTKK